MAFPRFILLFFLPFCAVCFFVITPFKVLSLLILFLFLLVVTRNARTVLYDFSALRAATFFLFVAATVYPELLPYVCAAFLIAGLIIIASNKTKTKFGFRAARFLTLVLWLLFSVLGHFMLPVFAGLSLNTVRACSGLDKRHATQFDAKQIRKYGTAYDVVSDGDRFIVNCRNATADVSGESVRRFPGDFQRAHFDPKDKTYAAASYWSHDFFIYDMKTGKQILRRNTGNKFFMDIDKFDGKYYLTTENNASFYVFDPVTKRFRIYPVQAGSPYSLRVNQRTGMMYVSTWGNGDLLMYDARTLKLLRRTRFFPSLMGITLNEERNTVLVAQPLKSRIVELDGKTLRRIRYLPAGFGARDIQYESDRNLVHAANYFSGTYTETDYASGKSRISARIGQSARGVYYDASTGHTYAVSNCGAFRF